MALDLNKSNDGNTTPSSSKQTGGLNLKKSDDSSGSKFNLSKDSAGGSTSGGSTPDSGNSGGKGRLIVGLLIVALLGFGIYYLIGGSKGDAEGQTGDATSTGTPEKTAGASSTPPPDSTTQNAGGATVDPATTAPGNTASEGGTPSNTNPDETGSTGQTGGSTGSPAPPTSTGQTTPTQPTNMGGGTTVTSPQLQGTLEEKARMVINGAFGNGADRRKALGDQYDEIQAKVNELLANMN
jgi:hypothetical protein